MREIITKDCLITFGDNLMYLNVDIDISTMQVIYTSKVYNSLGYSLYMNSLKYLIYIRYIGNASYIYMYIKHFDSIVRFQS